MTRIVLVHGAFGRPEVWDRVRPELVGAGHVVEAVTLPGAGDDATPLSEVTLESYAQRVCEALAAGPPAVLVGHSMGGVVITQAAANCPQHVRALVYVCAFAPADGQSLLALTELPEATGDQVQANMVVEGDPPVARMPAEAAREALMACCDDEQAAWGTAQLGPQPVLPFTEPVRVPGHSVQAFSALPRFYVRCLQDRAVRPALQQRMLATVGCRQSAELDADHMPMISRARELAAVLDRFAAAAG